MRSIVLTVLTVITLLAGLAPAHARQATSSATWPDLGRCTDIVIPQTRSFSFVSARRGVQVVAVQAVVKILEETAATTLEVDLRNDGPQDAEAVVLLPVPDGAAVSGFAFEGPAPEATARILPRDEARRLYDSIVSRLRDPALLEFAGYNLVRSSLFPVPARGTQRVRLTYEHLLPRDGERIDYILPRSESLASRVPWDIRVELRSKSPISMVYSPSHDLVQMRRDPHFIAAEIQAASRQNPGPFRLSYLRERDELTASLFAYPDPKVGGGYFLLVAGLPAVDASKVGALQREVTLVIDRSGSMAGPKMDQARAAALQIVEGLADGEAFNLIDYSTAVARFAPAPVIKTRETLLEARAYIAALQPNGGTNIHDALLEALRQPRTPGRTLPLVLFLTDGIPTVGQTTEPAIRALVEQGNPHGRRIFAFGVGADVNAPLLDRIADLTRATTTYVLPGEDTEVKVGQVYRRLFGPVLSDVRVETLDASGAVSTRLVRDLIPSRIPDRFEGDVVTLFGQYLGEQPIRFRIHGDVRGTAKRFDFEFDFKNATTRNAFVPRLWATRRIAYLVDQVRELGAAPSGLPTPVGAPVVAGDPRFQELTQEILRLSTEFGILTEYTSFLATDGTNLGNWRDLTDACSSNLDLKAVKQRSGIEAVMQGCNFNDRKGKEFVDYRNGFLDEKLARVETATVQAVCDRTFFQNGGRWVDGRLIGGQTDLVPDDVVEFGSAAHQQMVDSFIQEGRQGVLSLHGDILLEWRGRRVLVRNEAK